MFSLHVDVFLPTHWNVPTEMFLPTYRNVHTELFLPIHWTLLLQTLSNVPTHWNVPSYSLKIIASNSFKCSYSLNCSFLLIENYCFKLFQMFLLTELFLPTHWKLLLQTLSNVPTHWNVPSYSLKCLFLNAHSSFYQIFLSSNPLLSLLLHSGPPCLHIAVSCYRSSGLKEECKRHPFPQHQLLPG